MTEQSDKPNFLLITRYFPPLDGIATLRMYAWAKYLTRLGWKVSVLTTTKTGQVVHPLEVDCLDFDVTEVRYFDPLVFLGFDKARVGEAPQGRQGVSRALLSWAKRFYRERLNERIPSRTDPWVLPAVRQLRRWKHEGKRFDMIVSSYGPPAAHVVGCFAKRIFGAPWIADYRDLWIENHVFKGVWPFLVLERWLEKRLVSKADLITTVSSGLQKTLAGKFPSVPVTVIENGFDAELIDEAPADYFDGQPSRCRIVYTGSIFRGRRDPSPLFAAINSLRTEIPELPSKLEVLFYGSCSGNLDELVERHRVGDVVRYVGAVSQRDSFSIQKSADCLLFLEEAKPAIDGVLTGKLFEYLYSGREILAIGVTEDTASGKLILHLGAGRVLGSDVARIRDFLRQVCTGGSTASLSCRKSDVLGFSRKAQVQRLSDLIFPWVGNTAEARCGMSKELGKNKCYI